jgi:RNA polymerase sigma-70 factor (ECF subfamily)
VSLASGHHGRRDAAPAGGPAPAGSGAPNWAFPTPDWLAKQPRDPKKLLAAIEAAQEKGALQKADRPTLAFLTIAEVMSSGYVPADLRAALYRAARLIPGITLSSKAELDGRKGVSVSAPSPYGILQQEIVFDPKTGGFIGEREIVKKPVGDAKHLPVGSVYSSTSVTVDVTGNPKLF